MTNPMLKTELDQDLAVGPQLHRLLRASIIRGDIAPGARISETEIASFYNVSRQPVREAFIKLAEESLVVVRPQRGTFVTLISVPAVLTARFMREAIEADIVRLVAERAGAEEIAALEAEVEAQKALVEDAPGEAFMLADESFHRLLAQYAGQSAVADHLEEMKIHMNRVRHISARRLDRVKLVRQHAEVVAAIAAHDAERAAAAMRLHLRELLVDLPAILANQPEIFDGSEALA